MSQIYKSFIDKTQMWGVDFSIHRKRGKKEGLEILIFKHIIL